MERKGSGFSKIIVGYETQINYSDSKKPVFSSDRYQFTVIMANLNYDVPRNLPRDNHQDGPQTKKGNIGSNKRKPKDEHRENC